MRPTLSPWCGRPGGARPHRTPPYACARGAGRRPPAPNAALRVCAGRRAAPARSDRRLSRVRGAPGGARPLRPPPYACARGAGRRPPAPTAALRVCAGRRAAPARSERRLTRVRGAPGCARPLRPPPYACARGPGLRPPAPTAALRVCAGRRAAPARPTAALRVCAGRPGCARPLRPPPYACARGAGLRPPAPNVVSSVCAAARAAPARPLRQLHLALPARGTEGGARPQRTVASHAFSIAALVDHAAPGCGGRHPRVGPLWRRRLARAGGTSAPQRVESPRAAPSGGWGGALVPPAFCRCSRRHGARPGVPPPAPRRYVFRERRELLVAARGSGVSAASRWRAEPAGLGCPST